MKSLNRCGNLAVQSIATTHHLARYEKRILIALEWDQNWPHGQANGGGPDDDITASLVHWMVHNALIYPIYLDIVPSLQYSRSSNF